MPVVAATIADEHAWCAAALAGAAEAGGARWRVWRYPAPEIVLGCSQRAQLAAVSARAGPGIAVSVRPSGGGAVLAGPWMVGASVVLAPGHPLAGGGLVESYRWLGELHAALLCANGVAAMALDPDAARAACTAPLRWACFGALSAWEVVDPAGAKLTGLAQQRRRTGIAFSAGTLVTRPDWALLCDALGAAEDASRLGRLTGACDEAGGASLRDARDWAEALDAALERALR